MQKRGQLTIFIIVGVLLAIMAAFYFFLTSGPETETLTPEILPIKMFAQECLKDTAEDALVVTALQGGAIYLENTTYVDTFYSGVLYWYYLGEDNSPQLNWIQDNIDYYIYENLPLCIRDFEDFKGEITYGNPDTAVSIGQDSVFFDVEFPIKLKEGDSTLVASRFTFAIPVRLNSMLGIASQITSSVLETGGMDLGVISELPMDISFVEITDNYTGEPAMIYTITDSDFQLDGEPYKFVFAGGGLSHSFIEEDIGDGNNPPEFTAISDIDATEDVNIAYYFEAWDPDGDYLSFSTDSPLFDIDSNGVINFTPDDYDVGDHTAVIEVSDGRGGKDTEVINVHVEGWNDNSPEYNFIYNQTAVVGQKFTYDIGATDADGDELKYKLEFAPPGMTVSDEGIIEWIPPYPVDGYVILNVSDGFYTVFNDFVIYAIRDESPIISSISPQEAVVGQEFVLQIEATDADGDPLLYSDDSDLFDIGMFNGEIRFIPAESGLYTVTAKATDGILEDSETFTLRIS